MQHHTTGRRLAKALIKRAVDGAPRCDLAIVVVDKHNTKTVRVVVVPNVHPTPRLGGQCLALALINLDMQRATKASQLVDVGLLTSEHIEWTLASKGGGGDTIADVGCVL
jgi:hypothetical protein